ncbi:hypothetical protein PCANC_26243 [Puccinia coronata f. sp. avenae]|uniref:Extracellular membrane protein CFEM domain-containing protein n=2 Tax=Puccinia coronata f. sp. avenae TaxID=200324 RepID=A0A2N5TI40_9BASI|nr:hypothetical protein PCANC_26243 [Puccinia coronata f. sp. avenae]PLW25577.1 hypothetical protein PCASD_26221 [Puccinia coronata f. sp. avenae]
MFNPTSTLIATLVALPAIFAQSTNTSAAANSTGATAAANATSDSTASSAPFTAVTFTPVVLNGTTCGSAQQNLNQCIDKVGKDINNCGDNTCLCQTYANIAACYNGCAELLAQGQSYQAQSAQYCSLAGVKANTTATVTTSPAVTSTPTTNSSNTATVRTNTTSNAGTFSAAKSGAAYDAQLPIYGLLATLASGVIAVSL